MYPCLLLIVIIAESLADASTDALAEPFLAKRKVYFGRPSFSALMGAALSSLLESRARQKPSAPQGQVATR